MTSWELTRPAGRLGLVSRPAQPAVPRWALVGQAVAVAGEAG